MQVLVGVVFAVVAWAGVAYAQPAGQLTQTESITYTGTITDVNAPKRIVTTQGPDGFLATWEVPPTVPQAQVDALRVGQVLTVIYTDAIGIRRKAAGEPEVDTIDRTTNIRTATVTVGSVDVGARTVTFEGLRGRSHPRRLVQGNVDLLRTISVGDRVDVSWNETMQFVAGPVDDWTAHRSTVGFQWGARQPVLRPHRPGGLRTDRRWRADQAERDELRRCLWPDGTLQVRLLLQNERACRSRVQRGALPKRFGDGATSAQSGRPTCRCS